MFCTNWLLAIVMNAYFPISKVLEASYYYVLATLSYKLIGQLVFVFCYVGLAVLFLSSYALVSCATIMPFLYCLLLVIVSDL